MMPNFFLVVHTNNPIIECENKKRGKEIIKRFAETCWVWKKEKKTRCDWAETCTSWGYDKIKGTQSLFAKEQKHT